MSEASEIVWRPDQERIDASQLTDLIRTMGADNYDDLYARADQDPEWFWDGLLKFLDFRFYRPYDQVLDMSRGKAWTDWCIGGTTNAYLNCIEKHAGTAVWEKTFIDWQGEDGRTRKLSYREFDSQVNRLAGALKNLGVKPGDVVAFYLPMIAEVYVAFYACAKIGAIGMPLFSGFGPDPISSRLNESGARVVITADGTWRRGKAATMKPELDKACENAPAVEAIIVVEHMADNVTVNMKSGRDYWWHEVTMGQTGVVETVELPAEAPLSLAFTSGTTGKPKGIVQTHVGFVTKIAMDVNLMLDIKQDDCFFWLSDFGWMVGAMSAVAPAFSGARLMVAEGAPDHPRADRFWHLIEEFKISHFGIAPTAIRGAMALGRDQVEQHDLTSLKAIVTAGEPATPDAWNWMFEVVGKKAVPIINLSGGTEIGCSIVTGATILPLKACAFNGPSPGSGAAVFDADGKPVKNGEVGELVLTQPSIGLTKGFWGDGGDQRYLESYWQTWPDIWRHGDFAMIDEDGFWFLLGRSDDTIKVGGKRTGPAEIEALVMATGQVNEVAVIGIPDEMSGEAICIVAVPGEMTNPDELKDLLANAVVTAMGRAYRPRHIHFALDLPKTRSMKIMRRLIRSVLLAQPPGDLSALSNPESLDLLKEIRLPDVSNRI